MSNDFLKKKKIKKSKTSRLKRKFPVVLKDSKFKDPVDRIFSLICALNTLQGTITLSTTKKISSSQGLRLEF